MKRQNLRPMLVVFVLLCVSGCGAGRNLPPLDAAATPPQYQLGSGDLVRVTVFNEPQFSGEYTVDGSGHIAMPLIGAVPVDGLTVPAARNAITEQLSERALVAPDVSIEVINYRPFYILGEVRAPGQYPYVDDMTVLTAIAIAGGLTYRAETDRFSIVRDKDGQSVEWSAERNSRVQPGDVVTVFERYF